MTDQFYEIFNILNSGCCIYADYKTGIIGILKQEEKIIEGYFRISNTNEFDHVFTLKFPDVPNLTIKYSKVLFERKLMETL